MWSASRWTALSVDELAARIEVLRAEIERLEAARSKKDASRQAAAIFFQDMTQRND